MLIFRGVADLYGKKMSGLNPLDPMDPFGFDLGKNSEGTPRKKPWMGTEDVKASPFQLGGW